MVWALFLYLMVWIKQAQQGIWRRSLVIHSSCKGSSINDFTIFQFSSPIPIHRGWEETKYFFIVEIFFTLDEIIPLVVLNNSINFKWPKIELQSLGINPMTNFSHFYVAISWYVIKSSFPTPNPEYPLKIKTQSDSRTSSLWNYWSFFHLSSPKAQKGH